jgi:hypothetical protein
MSNMDVFIQAREYLIENVEPTLQAYICGIWDPCITFIIAREIDSIINKDLIEKFPALPSKFYPRFKYRMFEELEEIEINIQKYINTDSDLEYLGAIGMAGVLYDLYHRDAYDGSKDKYFIARYGHQHDSYFSGSKTAEAEYRLGATTPLSVAYGMAVNDGII